MGCISILTSTFALFGNASNDLRLRRLRIIVLLELPMIQAFDADRFRELLLCVVKSLRYASLPLDKQTHLAYVFADSQATCVNL